MKFLERYKLWLGAITATIVLGVMTYPYQPHVLAQRIDDLETKNKELTEYTMSHIQEKQLEDLNRKINYFLLIPEDDRKTHEKEQLLLLNNQKENLIRDLTK